MENITKLHEAQLLNYLKATGVKVGLLVNFQNKKSQIKRMVLDLHEEHDSFLLSESACKTTT